MEATWNPTVVIAIIINRYQLINNYFYYSLVIINESAGEECEALTFDIDHRRDVCRSRRLSISQYLHGWLQRYVWGRGVIFHY